MKQQKLILCVIQKENEKGERESGYDFISKIPTPVLKTNNQVLNENDSKPGNKIYISFNESNIKRFIKIDSKRRTYTAGENNRKEIDITIIEIFPELDELDEQEFIEMDEYLSKN